MKPVPRTSPEPRMEMAPLIDVVFLLLTFFVLSIVLMVRADVFDIELPEAAGAGAAQSPHIEVVLGADGGVRVDGEPVERRLVARTLVRRLEARPGILVRLAADENSRTGDFIRLQQELSQAGVTRVSILTSGQAPNDSGRAGDGPG